MIGAVVLAALIGVAFGSMSMALALVLGVPAWAVLLVVGAACAAVFLVGLAIR